jgi:hypothetical protein
MTAPAVLDHFHKLRPTFRLSAGESLFSVDADKDNSIIVLESAAVEIDLICQAVQLFIAPA